MICTSGLLLLLESGIANNTKHLADPCLNRHMPYHEVNYRHVKVSVASHHVRQCASHDPVEQLIQFCFGAR